MWGPYFEKLNVGVWVALKLEKGTKNFFSRSDIIPRSFSSTIWVKHADRTLSFFFGYLKVAILWLQSWVANHHALLNQSNVRVCYCCLWLVSSTVIAIMSWNVNVLKRSLEPGARGKRLSVVDEIVVL